MKTRGWIITLTLLGATMLALPARADEEEMVRVVQLEHAPVDDVVDVLRSLGLPEVASITGMEANGSIIVSGTEHGLETVMTLIEELDTPDYQPEPEAEEEQLAFLPVATYPLNEAAELIMMAIQSEGEVAIDAVNRRIVLRAYAKQIRLARDVIESLDKPEKSLTLQFFFLFGGLTNAAGEAAELPEALEPIEATLEMNGFDNFGLMTPILVRTMDGEEFTSNATINLPREDDEGGRVMAINLRGDLSIGRGTNHGSVKMHISANTRVRNRQDTWLETTLTLPLNNFLLIAASPNASADNGATAIVVRISDDSVAAVPRADVGR